MPKYILFIFQVRMYGNKLHVDCKVFSLGKELNWLLETIHKNPRWKDWASSSWPSDSSSLAKMPLQHPTTRTTIATSNPDRRPPPDRLPVGRSALKYSTGFNSRHRHLPTAAKDQAASRSREREKSSTRWRRGRSIGPADGRRMRIPGWGSRLWAENMFSQVVGWPRNKLFNSKKIIFTNSVDFMQLLRKLHIAKVGIHWKLAF